MARKITQKITNTSSKTENIVELFKSFRKELNDNIDALKLAINEVKVEIKTLRIDAKKLRFDAIKLSSNIKKLQTDSTLLNVEITKKINHEEFSEFKKELKNDIFNFKDEILNEIVKLREDMEVVTGWRDMMENHEGRIDKLEIKVFPQ